VEVDAVDDSVGDSALTPLQVRLAEVDDAPGIARVRIAGWQSGYRGVVPDSVLDSMSVEGFAERMKHWTWDPASRPHWVCVWNEQIVGWANAWFPGRDSDCAPTTAELVACYVLPEHWRKGIASELMSVAMAAAAEAGMALMTLWVLEQNQRAQAFYARHGFGPDGARKPQEFLVGADLWAMRMARSL